MIVQLPGAIDGFGLANSMSENQPGLDVILTSTVQKFQKLYTLGPIQRALSRLRENYRNTPPIPQFDIDTRALPIPWLHEAMERESP